MIKETTIKVNGMVCEGCENRVQNALKTIEGIENVVANHNNGTVTIVPTGCFDKKEVQEKIEDIGFEVIDMKEE